MVKKYQLKYLNTFQDDLIDIVNYIVDKLKNPQAAKALITDIEQSILERLKSPLSFEAYRSSKLRKNEYYRIYISNYTVYYVVIENVMEVRRLLYSSRDISKHI